MKLIGVRKTDSRKKPYKVVYTVRGKCEYHGSFATIKEANAKAREVLTKRRLEEEYMKNKKIIKSQNVTDNKENMNQDEFINPSSNMLKGVHKSNSRTKPYMVNYTVNGKSEYHGNFATIKEANAKAREVLTKRRLEEEYMKSKKITKVQNVTSNNENLIEITKPAISETQLIIPKSIDRLIYPAMHLHIYLEMTDKGIKIKNIETK